MATSASKPVSLAAMVKSIVGCKWSLRLLGQLAMGPRRPSALLLSCPGLSAKVMNERLRKFQGFALTARKVCGEKPPIEVDYSLTGLGEKFVGLLSAIERVQEEIDGAVRPGEAFEPPSPRQP